jgi:FkbM family methyltransferase
VLRKSKKLQPELDVAVALKGLKAPLPAVNTTKRTIKGTLPLYVPSKDKEHPLVQRQFQFNFTAKQADDVNFSRSHGLVAGGTACAKHNTIFDVGFYDGADSKTYLAGGYCVVGVEADPDLVAQALQNFAVFIANGQLQLANVAISPEGDATAWSVFYRSKCNKEWNSFYETVGCRACHPPHHVDHNACEQVKVTATDCGGLFATFGVPQYLKLDIEGAETGCFQALGRVGQTLPQFISAEITELVYIDTLHRLGYQGFKLVRQDRLISVSTRSSQSGPWGDNALDCRVGPMWRTYGEIRLEMHNILNKGLDPHDPCPGGTLPIRSSAKQESAYYMWYDIHATLTVQR